MSTTIPTVAQLFGSLIEMGYAIEIYLQKNSTYAIVVTKKGKPGRKGTAISAMTTRLLTAALIKIKRSIESENE